MLALPAGFRLRVEATAEEAANLVHWAARRPEVPPVRFPEVGPLPILQVAPKRRAAWSGYVARLADELAPSLLAHVRFDAAPTAQGLATEAGDLRWNQILTARAWGIGFSGAPAFIDDLERRVYTEAVVRLATRSRGAGRVMRRQTYEPNWLPGLLGDPLERLILDILNEEEMVAAMASLEEDFLEKTDLRVRYRELNRRRGARLQIAWAVTESSHLRKVQTLRYHEEFVFVTPFSVAQDLQTIAPGTTPDDVTGRFRFALRHAKDDPRGPLAQIPAEWRAAIRNRVRDDALATTSRLRTREENVRARRQAASAAQDDPEPREVTDDE